MTAEHGLHLRPAAKLVKVAGRFDCQIKIECNGSVADAKSVMSVMMLEAMLQDELTVIAEGYDACEWWSTRIDVTVADCVRILRMTVR